MLVAGFDVETTGLDTKNDLIIEAGVVLWDTERSAPLICYNALINHHSPDPLKPEIVELTGITDADITNYGRTPGGVLANVAEIFKKAEAVVAHNGNLFDKPILESNCNRHQIEMPPALWVDTSCDIDYPSTITTRKLVHLAAEHRFLNPFAHRAMFDVLTMLRVADHYDWEKTIQWAKSPSLVLIAETTFAQKELAKKLNYRWNSEAKVWTKSIKDFQLEEEKLAAKTAGFTLKVKES